MGLNVYLYKCADRAEADRVEAEYNQRSEAIWAEYGDYNQMTVGQKHEAVQRAEAVKQELGLGDWGQSQLRETIWIDSAKYPDHLFKIGRFVSSYNDSGINRYMARIGLPGLFEIMGVADQTPNPEIDWEFCLARVKEVSQQYKSYKYKQLAEDYYLQALEIVQETIEYVLAQPDQDDYYMVWSG